MHCGTSGDLALSTRKSLAIAIVRFWCAKLCTSALYFLGEGAQPPPRGFPRATFLRVRVSGRSVRYVARLCFGLMSDLVSSGACFVICGLVR